MTNTHTCACTHTHTHTHVSYKRRDTGLKIGANQRKLCLPQRRESSTSTRQLSPRPPRLTGPEPGPASPALGSCPHPVQNNLPGPTTVAAHRLCRAVPRSPAVLKGVCVEMPATVPGLVTVRECHRGPSVGDGQERRGGHRLST